MSLSVCFFAFFLDKVCFENESYIGAALVVCAFDIDGIVGVGGVAEATSRNAMWCERESERTSWVLGTPLHSAHGQPATSS